MTRTLAAVLWAVLDGTLRDVVALAPGRHAQPEGIAFGPGGAS